MPTRYIILPSQQPLLLHKSFKGALAGGANECLNISNVAAHGFYLKGCSQCHIFSRLALPHAPQQLRVVFGQWFCHTGRVQHLFGNAAIVGITPLQLLQGNKHFRERNIFGNVCHGLPRYLPHEVFMAIPPANKHLCIGSTGTQLLQGIGYALPAMPASISTTSGCRRAAACNKSPVMATSPFIW